MASSPPERIWEQARENEQTYGWGTPSFYVSSQDESKPFALGAIQGEKIGRKNRKSDKANIQRGESSDAN